MCVFSCWRWCQSWSIRASLFWCWGGNTCCGPPDPGRDTTWTSSGRKLIAFSLKTCERLMIKPQKKTSYGIYSTENTYNTAVILLLGFILSYLYSAVLLFINNLTPLVLVCLSVRRTTPSYCMPLCILGTTVSL